MAFMSLEHLVVTIGGHTIEGWASESDALMLPDLELFNITRGARGQMLAVRNGVRGGEVTIKLMPNSPSSIYFIRQIANILNGSYVLFQGTIEDANLNYTIALSNGVLATGAAGHTYGDGEVATREFTFDFEEIKPSYDQALAPYRPLTANT